MSATLAWFTASKTTKFEVGYTCTIKGAIKERHKQ